MSTILRNKHLITAMIVTPLLAIIAYLGVDYMVSEKPHAAVEGQSYPLIAKSNCRYKSGKCTLENGDIRLHILNIDNNIIEVNTELPVEGIKLGVANQPSSPLNIVPQDMQTVGNTSQQWQLNLPLPTNTPDNGQLYLALSVNQTVYFAEVSTIFMNYETGFSQQNINSNRE